MSGRSFLCDSWFSQTLRHKNYIYILIGWQAYRGDIGETTDTAKTALHNPEVKSKQSKKSLAGPIVHLK